MRRSLTIGSFAHHFTLPSTHGTISLFERVRADDIVLLVFRPKDSTLVCTPGCVPNPVEIGDAYRAAG